MPWLAIAFSAPPQWVEPYGDLLMSLGAVAVSEVDGGASPVLEPAPGTTPRWPVTRIEALFDLDADVGHVAGALDAFGRAHTAAAAHLDVRFVADSQWTAAWRRDWAPRRFGDRLWVVPTDTVDPNQGGVTLRLDPGLAFGTGNHPTTALCLEWLDRNAPVDASVVDYGCGSGILAIAAALLGATHVLAVDHDPQALTATCANAALNRIDPLRIVAIAPQKLRHPSETRHDLVIANILANPLIELAPVFRDLLRPGGKLVLSGILEDQVAAVCRAQVGVSFVAPVIADGWAMVAGTKDSG